MTIELIVPLLALAVALFAAKKARPVQHPVPPIYPPPVDTYTKAEIDSQLRGMTDSHVHLEKRVYELWAICEPRETRKEHDLPGQDAG